jgi:2-desacetyl-2-hydroxyethyl bacteriochlorophyllide A dehydrogenase
MFVEKGRAVLREEPVPGCGAGQVLCRTLYSGLTNGTERNVLLGGNYGGKWPSRCGYQNVGRVIEVGSGVQGFAVGDVLYSGNFHQHVAFFAASVANLADPNNLVLKLPPAVDPTQAALFGMASVAMHDVRRAEVRLGESVLVVGAGCIGQFTAQCARATGARVTVADLDEERLALARQLGAHHTVAVVDEAAWQGLRQQQGPFDVVFEDSGAPVLDRIIGATWGQRLIRYRGRVVLIAGRDRVDYSFNAGQGAELTFLHAGHFTRSDLEELCRLVSEDIIRVAPLIRDIVPIAQAVAVYDRLRDSPNSLVGTVFDWSGES